MQHGSSSGSCGIRAAAKFTQFQRSTELDRLDIWLPYQTSRGLKQLAAIKETSASQLCGALLWFADGCRLGDIGPIECARYLGLLLKSLEPLDDQKLPPPSRRRY